MTKREEQELAAQLRNIGPKGASYLVKAGITTPEQLRTLGTKEAFLRVFMANRPAITIHSAWLYALEGAITNTDWRCIPEGKKQKMRAFADALRVSI